MEVRTVAVDKDDDDMFDTVSSMADRIGLKGKERTSYIHEHMTRSGYRAVPNYVKDDGDDDDDDDSGGFFRGSDKRRSRSRDDDDDDRGSRRSRRSRGGGDDWYNG
jgi:hypothetical protein